ncbi:hypothetical protein RYX36_033606, partial [Vicia faba]
CCWAFATLACFKSAISISTNCDIGSNSYERGSTKSELNYIWKKRISMEKEYPYKVVKKEICGSNKIKSSIFINDYEKDPFQVFDEGFLLRVVTQCLIVAFIFVGKEFEKYRK